MTPAPHCYCTRGTCQECRDQADDMADDDNNTAPVWVHGQHEKEDRTMSDQQTRYYTHFDGDWHYVLDRNSVLSRIRCVVSDDATHIAAALSACDGADDPQPGELARLRANYYTACQYASLDPDMPVPGGLTRDECGMWIASRDKTIAAQAAEIKALRDLLENFDYAYLDGIENDTLQSTMASYGQAVDLALGNTTTESEATCSYCGGDGAVDSGGVTLWGTVIDIPCPACTTTESEADSGC